MTRQADLIAYLFGGEQDTTRQASGDRLSSELLQWTEASPRFTAFVDTYRDKIRKKIRVNREPESQLDLRAELEVALGLLHDRRLTIAYEPYASAKRRGPDFAVTYRTNLVFNIEVARLRVEEGKNSTQESKLARNDDRVMRILLNKLGQTQPGMANLLLIHTREEAAQNIDLGSLMQEVKTRVDGRVPDFFTATHYTSPASFYKDFLRMSDILLWTSAPADMDKRVWINKQAQPGLDGKVLRVVWQALQAGFF